MPFFEARDQFYLDGKPFQIISGGIHYFRTVPQYWRDRLEKLKALGCNTVETYVAWNLHEPDEGRFDFSGGLDIAHFLKIAAELGLYAIVRPSPYICAEWEFGGLPAWLLTKPDMELRSGEGAFLAYVRRYYERLLPLLTPLQIDQGGNILLMQVENEYGYYGDDKAYLSALRDMMRELHVTVPLITSDGPMEDTLAAGSLPGVLPTANFGSKASQRLEILHRHVGDRPLMCTEFWVGWFDHWGCGKHNQSDSYACAEDLRVLLTRGHVNFYMFHGGTNFGFMNGANDYDCLTPDVTSYDYDALLTEDGRITPKYLACQEVIRSFLPGEHMHYPLPAEIKRAAYGEIPTNGAVSLFEALDSFPQPLTSAHPQPMERLGQAYGYVLYRSTLPHDIAVEKFRLWETNDRAQVFFNQELKLTLYDRELLSESKVDWDYPKDTTLDILVENMGRVNFGVKMRRQRKGIAGDVLLNGRFHTGWAQYTLPFTKETLQALSFQNPASFKERKTASPAFFRFSLPVGEACDTFLDMRGWGKGCVFLNGFCLGRFWELGPQKRLYVPAPLLRAGENECIVFETEGTRRNTIAFYDEPDLG